MALQNIGAVTSLVTKIEDCGNGIFKTNVVNVVDISKALSRPASYITTYFGYELRALPKFDDKTGVALVHGSDDADKLTGLLERFIQKFVWCQGCRNLGTEVVIHATIQLKCAACGYVSDVDMRDKLSTFILLNPPGAEGAGEEKMRKKYVKPFINQSKVLNLNPNRVSPDEIPMMVTKIEDCGNGIKTNVVNMVDIAKALSRPASYITTYFGYELRALPTFDYKTGVALVHGSHEAAKLTGLLEKFIQKFVQCHGCRNLATEVIIHATNPTEMSCMWFCF